MPVRASPLHTSDERVMPMTLDVTNAVEIQGTFGRVESLDILVNNAGVDLHDDLSDSDRKGWASPPSICGGCRLR
jgi:NADP-dependent 3-hydroxy acid dehydrogenase YdfG